ncbi:cytosine permease [Leucobacter sp. CSA1]|uniref:Cytosine permease n=1 Tax=Leucobacter chromiisoli TaxID=2796471 RepID=A0A934Q469_9MICO|nr:cytosine permease [Leucobacter chromiisoli]MBK0418049.1 cytosine permease [Leucobacter chromiisoli]
MSGPVEQRGIDLVPLQNRYGKPRDLFFLWAGTTTNIYTVTYGALLVLVFGLSFPQAVIAIVAGNILAYPLLGLTSLQGPTTGTTTMTISRASLGPNAARVNGVFSWLMLIGFQAGGLILVYYAVDALLGFAGLAVDGALQIALIALLGVIQMLLPLFGHRLLMAAQKYATVVFAVAFVVLAVLIVPQIRPDSADVPFSMMGMISAIALVVVSGGLSWAPSGANFSRYLPAESNPRSIALWAGLGGFLPYVLLQTLGAGMATVAVDDTIDLTNPLAIPAMLPTAFAVPFLLLVVVGLMVQNSTNIYSSGLNLQTAGIHAPRWLIVITDTVACVVIAVIAVSQSSFYELLNAFVASLSIWLAPWVTIYLIDWIMRRGRYRLSGLANERGGVYWGTGGVRWPGFISLVVGMVAAALCANTGTFVGPVTQLFSPDAPAYAPDLSIIVGMVVSGLLYAILNRTDPTLQASPEHAHPGTAHDEEFTHA